MKAGLPKPLDHTDQVDERSSRGLVKDTQETGHHQASLHGSLSRIPIIENHLIRPELFRQEHGLALTRLKVAQIPGHPWSDWVNFQPRWRGLHPSPYSSRSVWVLKLRRDGSGNEEPVI